MSTNDRSKDSSADLRPGSVLHGPADEVFPRPSAEWFSVNLALDGFRPLPKYAAARVIPGILYPNRKAPLSSQEVAAIASLLNTHFPYFDWLDFRTPLAISLENNSVVASFRFKAGFEDFLSDDEKEQYFPKFVIGHHPSEKRELRRELATPDLSLVFHDNIVNINRKLAKIEYSIDRACILVSEFDTSGLKTSDEKVTRARPDLPRWAEENRPTQLVRVRLEPDIVEALDRAARNEGQTRTEWIKEAIQSRLASSKKPEPQ